MTTTNHALKLLIKMKIKKNAVDKSSPKCHHFFRLTFTLKNLLGPLKSSPNAKFSPNLITH
jgi:hypothetical protein